MVLHLVLLAGGALAQTPAPTVPTPFPTMTTAPVEDCLYLGYEVGPFALDCLQDMFLKAGCSVRGNAYPTEGRMNSVNLEILNAWYDDSTWADVQVSLQGVVDEAGPDCFGNPTDFPTPSPSSKPTTRVPTPSPSIPPTDAENAIGVPTMVPVSGATAPAPTLSAKMETAVRFLLDVGDEYTEEDLRLYMTKSRGLTEAETDEAFAIWERRAGVNIFERSKSPTTALPTSLETPAPNAVTPLPSISPTTTPTFGLVYGTPAPSVPTFLPTPVPNTMDMYTVAPTGVSTLSPTFSPTAMDATPYPTYPFTVMSFLPTMTPSEKLPGGDMVKCKKIKGLEECNSRVDCSATLKAGILRKCKPRKCKKIKTEAECILAACTVETKKGGAFKKCNK